MLSFDYAAIAATIDGLDRRRRLYRSVGWLYVLRNPAYREPILKIGKSSRPPTVRATELARATGVPGEFQLLYFVHVGDMHSAERFVHARLASSRTMRNKEFFQVPLNAAIENLDQAAEEYPLLVEDGRHLMRLPQCLGARVVPCPGCGKPTRVRRLAVDAVARCGSCQHQFVI